jgi:hypothetical protein
MHVDVLSGPDFRFNFCVHYVAKEVAVERSDKFDGLTWCVRDCQIDRMLDSGSVIVSRSNRDDGWGSRRG